MLDGQLERDAATHRIAEHVDLGVAELLQHADHVVADVDQADLAIAQRRAAVALQIDADHLPALRELGQVGTEHLDLEHAAMKEQQRLTRAIDGVVVVHAVDRGMAALGGLGRYGLHGRLLLGCVNDRRDRKAGGNSRNHCDQRLDGHRGSPSAMYDEQQKCLTSGTTIDYWGNSVLYKNDNCLRRCMILVGASPMKRLRDRVRCGWSK